MQCVAAIYFDFLVWNNDFVDDTANTATGNEQDWVTSKMVVHNNGVLKLKQI